MKHILLDVAASRKQERMSTNNRIDSVIRGRGTQIHHEMCSPAWGASASAQDTVVRSNRIPVRSRTCAARDRHSMAAVVRASSA
jgi:hypothetical protein